MKKASFVLIAIALATVLLPSLASAKLRVVTTIPDLAALAQEVGQDRIDVESLARGDQDPHYLEPKPSYAQKLNRADLVIEVGLQLEVGWLPVLLIQSRNPKIQAGNAGHLIASEGINILEIPSGPVDRSQGDVHPEGNPHYWLDPRNGIVIASHIAEKLSELDPANASFYRQNFQAFKQRLSQKIDQWGKEIASFRGREVVTYHKSFSYFADWTGLRIAGFVEPKPGIPPPPAHILALIDLIKADKIPAIITENYYDLKPSQQLSEKTGAKLVILPTSVGGEASVKTYEDLFDTLIRKLKEAL